MPRNLKTSLGNTIPEIVIHARIGVFQGNVADDTERDEWHLIDMTHLCY